LEIDCRWKQEIKQAGKNIKGSFIIALKNRGKKNAGKKL
jgi:hypothetical protein